MLSAAAFLFCQYLDKVLILVLDLQLVREGVVFERLLLGQTQHKVFIIHNTSLLPVKWRLAGADALPPEFKVIPSSGEVAPRQETLVTVEFTAMQKKDLSEKVTLQVSNHATVQQAYSMMYGTCRHMTLLHPSSRLMPARLV